MRYVEARKEKRHQRSKMETALHNLVKKCTDHHSGLSYCIPNADKCVVGKGDKSFNLLVSKARFVIANVVAHAPRQDGDGPDEDVYNSFQGDIGNEPIPSIKRI